MCSAAGRPASPPGGFPHSGTPGSKAVCASPGPIAACRALLRLPVPRHPPCAFRIFRPGRAAPGAGSNCHDPWNESKVDSLAILHTLSSHRGGCCDQMRAPAQRPGPSNYALCGSQGTGGGPPRGRTPREGRGGTGAGTVAPARSKGVFLKEASLLPRKEVIQPHLPVRLPCYDFTPLAPHTLGASPGGAGDFGCRRLGWCDGRCVQGPGTHSPRRADPRLLATPTSRGRVAAPDPNWGRL